MNYHKEKAPITELSVYLPAGTDEMVIAYLKKYGVQLTITPERRSLLGNYRFPYKGEGHRISVNGNLNKYSFLLTLLHEIAHMLTFINYGPRVASHGKEWKMQFRQLLSRFINKNFLPKDIEAAVMVSLQNPAASTCTDAHLTRALKKYNPRRHNHFFVEQLQPGELFKTPDGKVYRVDEKLRKRFKCTEVHSKRKYLFSPVYEVEKVKVEG